MFWNGKVSTHHVSGLKQIHLPPAVSLLIERTLKVGRWKKKKKTHHKRKSSQTSSSNKNSLQCQIQQPVADKFSDSLQTSHCHPVRASASTWGQWEFPPNQLTAGCCPPLAAWAHIKHRTYVPLQGTAASLCSLYLWLQHSFSPGLSHQHLYFYFSGFFWKELFLCEGRGRVCTMERAWIFYLWALYASCSTTMAPSARHCERVKASYLHGTCCKDKTFYSCRFTYWSRELARSFT